MGPLTELAMQMARERIDASSVCCMKNDGGNIMSDADGRKKIWRKYVENLLNLDNGYDGEVACPEVMGSCCLISEKDIAETIKGLNI